MLISCRGALQQFNVIFKHKFWDFNQLVQNKIRHPESNSGTRVVDDASDTEKRVARRARVRSVSNNNDVSVEKI